MDHQFVSKRLFCILSGMSGVAGVVLLMTSFAINSGPPPGVGSAALTRFGQEHYANILWGAWLQAVGPVFIVLFALALVHLSGATQRLSGWMTMFGASVLMTVSLIEITIYISALNPDPELLSHDPFLMSAVSMKLGHAVQHLYFIVAAPTLFLPLGTMLVQSQVLPRLFGYLALLLGAAFAFLGMAFLLTLTLPTPVTAFAAVQALWWLAAAITLIARSQRLAKIG